MKRASTAIIATVSSLILVSLPAGDSFAASETLQSRSQLSAAEAFLLEHDVDAETSESLLTSVEAGKPTGSFAGLDVVDEETFREGSRMVTVETYSDGAVEVTELEQPLLGDKPNEGASGQVTDRNAEAFGKIKGCKVKAGSGYTSYTNCTVSRSSVQAFIAFTASYTFVKGGHDYISSIGQATHRCLGASCSDVKSRTIRKKETSAKPAQARGSMTVTMYKGLGSKGFWVDLKVRKNKATTVNGG